MKKKQLTAAVLTTLMTLSASAYAAEQTDESDEHELGITEVRGTRAAERDAMTTRTTSLGVFGRTNVLDAPMNVISYTNETLKKNFVPTRGFLNAATNNPSVVVGGASTDNNVELQIRGIAFNTHDILLDGVPGMIMMQNQPTNYIGRMEIIVGPNAVISGIGLQQSASGFVNFVPKKAEARPNIDLTTSYSSSRYFTHSIDWGQRFGRNNAWGIRINAETYSGSTTMTGEDLHGRDLYINIDHADTKSKSSFLYGYDTSTHHAMPEVLRIKDTAWGTSVTHLPSADSVVKNFMPRWALISHAHRVYLLQHEQKLGRAVAIYAKAGLMHRDWPGYITSKPWLQNDAGDYTLGISGSSTMGKTDRRVFMTGIKYDVTSGILDHTLTLGYDYLSQYGWSTYAPGTTSNLTGNIYQGLITDPGAPLAPEGQWYVGSKTNNRSIVLTDSITSKDGRLKIVAGVRHQTIHTRSLSRAGVETKSYKKSANTPTFGVLYKISPRTAIYANYAESLGTVSPPNTVINKDDVMPPIKTKQYEIGAKWDMGSWASTLSIFRINQPTALVNASNYYVLDGMTRSHGLEWNVFGRVAPHLNLVGGFMILNAEYERTQGGALDGKRVFGTPQFNATVALDWETKVKGLNVYGRMHHFGGSYADSKNRISVPAWTRFDLGAQYKTEALGYPMVLNFMIYNVFNKMYWSSTDVKWSDGGLMLNPGRTYMLSATISL